jgi:hypothetical protein
MSNEWEERRRVPRVPVRAGHVYLRSTWSTVQLLDISLGGALLAASRMFKVGQRGELRGILGGERVAVQVEVRREDVTATPDQPGAVRCAVAFVAIDENSRRGLEKFLRHRVAE